MMNAVIPKKTIPLTQAAFDKYKADIARLMAEKKELQKRVNIAREMGDLSENGAYKYAKIELGSVNKQLRDIHQLLDEAVITAPKANSNIVEFGSKVNISDGNTQETYTIVSMYESDLSKKLLSQESPIGAALLGKKKGDTVQVTTPAGTTTYTILSIE